MSPSSVPSSLILNVAIPLSSNFSKDAPSSGRINLSSTASAKLLVYGFDVSTYSIHDTPTITVQLLRQSF
jgi:hypothetical protein